MKYYIQIIGAYTRDSFPSILVHFDSGRYLFNAAEGTQRFLYQHRLKLAKLKHIFLTRSNWDCFGGLPGVVLTLSDVESVDGVQVYGPRNLTHLLAGCREFVCRPGFAVQSNDVSEGLVLKDANLSVHSVLLLPESSESPMDAFNEVDDLQRRSVVEGMFSTKADATWSQVRQAQRLVKRLPKASPSTGVLCYICQGPDRLGKLDLDLLASIGVKRGPLFGKLIRGESVTLPNGRTVHPSECVSPASKGARFIIIECPTLAYLNPLINNATLLASARDLIAPVQCIIHIAGSRDILLHPDYKEWIGHFPQETQHIYLSPESTLSGTIFPSSTVLQKNFHELDSDMFPTLFESEGSQKSSILGLNSLQSEPLIIYQMEPTAKLDRSECGNHADPIYLPNRVLKAFKKEVVFAKELVASDSRASNTNTSGVIVCPMGTNSAIPSKYRNVSCTLVRENESVFVMDCGEGSLDQMYRAFGDQVLDKCLSQIQLIFISHLHADHHLGLFRILKERRRVLGASAKSLLMVAPKEMATWLDEYSDVDDIGLESIQFIKSESLLIATQESLQIISGYGLESLKTIRVEHCASSFAIHGKSLAGFTFAFSGDCRPSEKFAKMALGVDLLIHEATHDNEDQDEAIDKKHCTIDEAVTVAKRMEAKHTLLTHFSGRYGKLPKWQSIPRDFLENGNVVTAFDFMQIPLASFWKVRHYLPALQVLLQDETGDTDGKPK